MENNWIQELNHAFGNDDIAKAVSALYVHPFNEGYREIAGNEKFYNERVGRAVIRNRGAAVLPILEAVVDADALAGEVSYPRANGELYFARKWGDHSDVEALRKARVENLYTMFYGAPGCGKTALVEAAFGDDLYTVLGTGDTEVGDFLGGYVQTIAGNFEWVDGPLVRAAEEGKVLLIDEVGLIDPKVMAIVYGLMDGRREIDVRANPERGTVKAKEGFYVVAATNPNAPGVRLSEALLSRFLLQVEMTTDWSLAKKLGVPAPAVTAAQNLARKQETGEVSWAPQFRELLGFKQAANVFGLKFAIQNILASAPEMDRPVVADVFARVFGEELKPAKI
jgi:nitric oxide reductase NorQ protein